MIIDAGLELGAVWPESGESRILRCWYQRV